MARPRKTPTQPAKADRILRPVNSFMCFRMSSLERAKKFYPGVRLTKAYSALWKSIDDVERRWWQAIAALALAEHSRQHPHYKFQPQHSKKKGSSGTDGIEMIVVTPETFAKVFGPSVPDTSDAQSPVAATPKKSGKTPKPPIVDYFFVCPDGSPMSKSLLEKLGGTNQLIPYLATLNHILASSGYETNALPSQAMPDTFLLQSAPEPSSASRSSMQHQYAPHATYPTRSSTSNSHTSLSSTASTTPEVPVSNSFVGDSFSAQTSPWSTGVSSPHPIQSNFDSNQMFANGPLTADGQVTVSTDALHQNLHALSLQGLPSTDYSPASVPLDGQGPPTYGNNQQYFDYSTYHPQQPVTQPSSSIMQGMQPYEAFHAQNPGYDAMSAQEQDPYNMSWLQELAVPPTNYNQPGSSQDPW